MFSINFCENFSKWTSIYKNNLDDCIDSQKIFRKTCSWIKKSSHFDKNKFYVWCYFAYFTVFHEIRQHYNSLKSLRWIKDKNIKPHIFFTKFSKVRFLMFMRPIKYRKELCKRNQTIGCRSDKRNIQNIVYSLSWI